MGGQWPRGPRLLAPTGNIGGPQPHDRVVPKASNTQWVQRYQIEVDQSREDFVPHHHQKYGGRLPVWAAIELLDWESLTYLYGFAPRDVQDVVANACGLSPPQLTSWLKALNLVRNTCAHHGRLFHRVHTIVPKLPAIGHDTTDWSRTFGQLTLIQFLSDRLGAGRNKLLPAVVRSFPTVRAVRSAHMGIPDGWRSCSPLWA